MNGGEERRGGRGQKKRAKTVANHRCTTLNAVVSVSSTDLPRREARFAPLLSWDFEKRRKAKNVGKKLPQAPEFVLSQFLDRTNSLAYTERCAIFPAWPPE
jgi:hypothetical protein